MVLEQLFEWEGRLARKEVRLDCARLTLDSRQGSRMFARLRYYYASRSAHFERSSTDLAVHEYAYNQYVTAELAALKSVVLISKEDLEHNHQAWLAGKPAPDYLCSELRRALRDRDHRLISVPHLERYHIPATL